MIYNLIIIISLLIITGILLYFKNKTKILNEQSFYPHICLTGLNGTVYYLDLSKNKYILVVKLYDELLDVITYSKSRKIYKEGDNVTIIGQSDGLYFIE